MRDELFIRQAQFKASGDRDEQSFKETYQETYADRAKTDRPAEVQEAISYAQMKSPQSKFTEAQSKAPVYRPGYGIY
jgi:hypothetical protein